MEMFLGHPYPLSTETPPRNELVSENPSPRKSLFTEPLSSNVSMRHNINVQPVNCPVGATKFFSLNSVV
jgi:hypothetical protein